jgi:hypothetical protein
MHPSASPSLLASACYRDANTRTTRPTAPTATQCLCDPYQGQEPGHASRSSPYRLGISSSESDDPHRVLTVCLPVGAVSEPAPANKAKSHPLFQVHVPLPHTNNTHAQRSQSGCLAGDALQARADAYPLSPACCVNTPIHHHHHRHHHHHPSKSSAGDLKRSPAGLSESAHPSRVPRNRFSRRPPSTSTRMANDSDPRHAPPVLISPTQAQPSQAVTRRSATPLPSWVGEGQPVLGTA